MGAANGWDERNFPARASRGWRLQANLNKSSRRIPIPRPSRLPQRFQRGQQLGHLRFPSPFEGSRDFAARHRRSRRGQQLPNRRHLTHQILRPNRFDRPLALGGFLRFDAGEAQGLLRGCRSTGVLKLRPQPADDLCFSSSSARSAFNATSFYKICSSVRSTFGFMLLRFYGRYRMYFKQEVG
jgi:hypothetical protein